MDKKAKKVFEILRDKLECIDCPYMKECNQLKPGTCAGALYGFIRADIISEMSANSTSGGSYE